MRTVKEISDLTGISVRTLHYYDEIGLLKPTEKSDAGYRLYDDRHTIATLYAISQSVDRISSQQHRKGHVLPDAGGYAIQREGGRERNPVCLLPHHSHCRSPVPQPHDGQAFSE